MVPQEFKDLPPEEQTRVKALGEELSRAPMTYAVPIFFADPPGSTELPNLNNGTGSLISFGEAKFCITNFHVLDAYRRRKVDEPEIVFHIANIRLDPDEILISESNDYDLAVLDISNWEAEEFASYGEIPTQFLDVAAWPPEMPKIDSFVMFGGYPGYWREALGPMDICFSALGCGSSKIISSNDQNLVCQLEIDKCHVHRPEPGREEPGDLTGLSGGPVLREKQTEDGITTFEFVGIIYEYGADLDCLRIRPATLIMADGKIREQGE